MGPTTPEDASRRKTSNRETERVAPLSNAMTIYFYKTGQCEALLRKSKLMSVHVDSAKKALLGLRVPEEEKHLVLVLLEGVELDRRLLKNVSYNPVPLIIVEVLSISQFK